MDNVIGRMPEFTVDEGTPAEEVNAVTPEEEAPAETETPSAPPAENPPVGEETVVPETPPAAPDDHLEKQLRGLQEERAKLIREVAELRGQKREIKQEELFKVENTITEIEGIDPDDVQRIDKVLRAKGYVTKDEASHMFYESVKQEEVNKFLERHPEYRPENDPGDVNWQTLQREISLYKAPSNPHGIAEILERSHKNVSPGVVSAPRPAPIAQARRQLEVASVGSGGTPASSTPSKSLTSRYRDELIRGGWTEEDIKNIESNL